MYLRNRDKKLLEDLSWKLEEARKERFMSILRVAASANMQPDTINSLVHTGQGNIVSLLRYADALNMDIILVKRKREKEFFEVPGAQERLYKLKQYQLNGKRNERLRKQERASSQDIGENENDFLSDDGISNEVS